MQYDNNLNKLREQFDILGIDAIFLSMYNAFGNYLDSISDIQYFSGFSGSNGRCFISKDKAIISVDGRYIKQAKTQVNNELWEVEVYPGTSVTNIIKEIIKPNSTFGICKYSLKYSSYLKILELSKQLNFNIKLIDEFPIIKRQQSNANIILLNENSIGKSINERINKVKSKLNDNEGLLITDSSMIGWITGLRLSESTNTHSIIPSAAVLITKTNNKPIIFCDLNIEYDSNDFVITSLNNFEHHVKQLNINTVRCEFTTTCLYFPYTLSKFQYNIINDNSIGEICSIKNNTEIQNQKDGSLLTSLAMIKVLALAETNNIKSELEAIDVFYNELKQNNNFVDFSFDSISAFGNNSAIIHYNPRSFSNNTDFTGDGLFLFDGGAHFKYSTTDMTRTIYIGDNPSDEIKKQYTLLLKSTIDFSMIKFPNKIKAYTIDAIARAPLWQYGYNYAFGTGHGVSAFGNVHEHPSISTNSNNNILENMIITIEPGIYTNNTGIRMENMLLVKKSQYLNYNEFETINYIPFSHKLIIRNILSDDEIKWLNNYNLNIRNKCLNYFSKNELIQDWILYNTNPL